MICNKNQQTSKGTNPCCQECQQNSMPEACKGCPQSGSLSSEYERARQQIETLERYLLRIV